MLHSWQLSCKAPFLFCTGTRWPWNLDYLFYTRWSLTSSYIRLLSSIPSVLLQTWQDNFPTLLGCHSCCWGIGELGLFFLSCLRALYRGYLPPTPPFQDQTTNFEGLHFFKEKVPFPIGANSTRSVFVFWVFQYQATVSQICRATT